MRGKINTFEIVGIFVSVGAMALLLIFLNSNAHTFGFNNNAAEEQGAVVVVSNETSNEERALAEALVNAVGGSNELASLVLKDVRLGSGAGVDEGDTVVVEYIGATQDGSPFDSSYERGMPFVFTVGAGKVIQGWEKGLLGMREGGQRILIIPPEMGYGNRQVGPIPANAVLVFAVELLEVRE